VFGSELIFIALILIFRSYLTESEPTLKWKDLDVLGAVLSIISLVLIVLGILFLTKPQYWEYVVIFNGFRIGSLHMFPFMAEKKDQNEFRAIN